MMTTKMNEKFGELKQSVSEEERKDGEDECSLVGVGPRRGTYYFSINNL